jgi:hypothetical protein
VTPERLQLHHHTSIGYLHVIYTDGAILPKQDPDQVGQCDGEVVWLTSHPEKVERWSVRNPDRNGADEDIWTPRVRISVEVPTADLRRAETFDNPGWRKTLRTTQQGRYHHKWWVTDKPIPVANFVGILLDGIPVDVSIGASGTLVVGPFSLDAEAIRNRVVENTLFLSLRESDPLLHGVMINGQETFTIYDNRAVRWSTPPEIIEAMETGEMYIGGVTLGRAVGEPHGLPERLRWTDEDDEQ